MPRGASPKREREYDELKERFEEEGRYKGRGEEVAARIVNKQRRMYGETKAEKAKDRRGQSPDRGLPVDNYQHLTIPQVEEKLQRLSRNDIRRIEEYERKHKNRKKLIEALEQRLKAA